MRTQLKPQETADGLTYVLGVRKDEDTETYEGGCSCGFRTSNWPLKRQAEDRIEGHATEHLTAEPMTELAEYMLAEGISQPSPDASVFGDDTDLTEDDQ